MHFDFTATPIYNLAAIRFAAIHDNETLSPAKEIRLRINSYKPPTRAPTLSVRQQGSTFAANPLKPYAMDGANYVTGGFTVGYGASTLPKITMEGWIDTSVADDGNGNMIPQTTVKSSTGPIYNLTDAELIPLYIEGRLNVNPIDRRAIHPIWFRDPYGRVYSNPRIIDYEAGFLEAVPGRCTFKMVLLV